MCFGKSDLRGEGPSGLGEGDEKIRVSSREATESREVGEGERTRVSVPEGRGKRVKVEDRGKGGGDEELGDSYAFVFPIYLSFSSTPSSVLFSSCLLFALLLQGEKGQRRSLLIKVG